MYRFIIITSPSRPMYQYVKSYFKSSKNLHWKIQKTNKQNKRQKHTLKINKN